ncbi:MAG: hypothetical protein KDI71_03705 [Xanthomonadales bacterium]|nr:hypothetical protein [Xanthomonadales bacterium]
MPVLTFNQLQEATGYQRLSDVERCLKDQGIRFFRGKGGIWTTIELVNAAGGLTPNAAAEEPYSPDLAA